MKKLILTSMVLGLALVVFTVLPAKAVIDPIWDVTGNYIINVNYLSVNYPETLILTQDGIDITGVNLDTIPPASLFIVTDGSVIGNIIHIVANKGSLIINMDGTIAPDGSMSGNWFDVAPGTRTGTWATTTGTADNDSDDDGVLNGNDLCPSTTEDLDWGVSWGNNRWEVRNTIGGLTWFQNKVKKGTPTPTPGENIAYTYGCNGHQILQMLNEKLGNVMNGHWKYGLSSGVLEDFHLDLNDGVLDGRYFIETVTVPANKSTDSVSVNPLVLGVNYILKARGTADAGDGITFDARYSIRAASSPTTWTDAVSTYESYELTLLDLLYSGSTPWGTYDSSHVYETTVTGTGTIAPFRIYDVYYPNNTGNLYVDIYAEL